MNVKSRYAETPLFSPDQRGASNFAGVRPRDIPPAPGVVEHTIAAGDRLDRMATHYYNGDRLWYLLVDANFSNLYGPDLIFDADAKFNPATDPLDRRDRVAHVMLVPRAEK